MNERIRQLLIQSEVFNKDGTVLKDVTGYELNKFAELIVRECIEMSKLEAAHYSAQAVDAKSKQAFEFEFNSAATCLGVGLRIKKHFGLEEE
jgi:hypothetical protein